MSLNWQLKLGPGHQQNCTRHVVQSYTTPTRIAYTQNETQHIDADTPCSWLMDHFKPEGWECDAFPNPHSIAQILLAGLICNAIVFPFKVTASNVSCKGLRRGSPAPQSPRGEPSNPEAMTLCPCRNLVTQILLRFLFTFEHYSHTSHWDKLTWVEYLWDLLLINFLNVRSRCNGPRCMSSPLLCSGPFQLLLPDIGCLWIPPVHRTEPQGCKNGPPVVQNTAGESSEA